MSKRRHSAKMVQQIQTGYPPAVMASRGCRSRERGGSEVPASGWQPPAQILQSMHAPVNASRLKLAGRLGEAGLEEVAHLHQLLAACLVACRESDTTKQHWLRTCSSVHSHRHQLLLHCLVACKQGCNNAACAASCTPSTHATAPHRLGAYTMQSQVSLHPACTPATS